MPNATSVWDFSDGEILTAAKLDDVNCGIHVFANSTARTNAYGGTGERTLVEGEFSYLADTNTTQYYDGSSWLTLGGKIAQVVSTAKTDSFTTTSTTFVDITGLSLTITPTQTTSKILIMSYVVAGVSGDIAINARLMRDSTAIFIGDAAGSRPRDTYYAGLNVSNLGIAFSPIYLDSPSTTSAITYKVQVFCNTGTLYVNRSTQDRDTTAYDGRTASSITAFEVIV